MLYIVGRSSDQHLDDGLILVFILTPRQTQSHGPILDTPTIHQLATVIKAHSHNHSLRVVIYFNQTK